MGNRYRVTMKFYSDAERTNLIKSVNTSFGIAVAAPTFTESFTVWEPSAGVFDAYLAGGETSSLGVPYQDRVPPFVGTSPNTFIPISDGIVVDDGIYYSIIFNNGARIESSVGVGGRLEIAYDKDGNQVHAFTGQQSIFTSAFNGWYREFAIVAKSITDHVISSELGTLGIQGAYQGSWKQQAFGIPPAASWLSSFLNTYVPYTSSDENPYEPGGIATTGGGGMSGEPITSDSIDFPSLPDIGAVDAGFVSIWTPTEAQVKNLAHYLWTTDITEGAFWRKLIQNPLELIFGLQILPVPIYHTDETGDPQDGEYIAAKDAVVLGWTKTGIKMDYIVDQYIEVDCGSIDMEEYWHAFLDYEPYTKIDIFLPYIGTKHLDTNDLMPRTLSLKYVIDIASGICVAMLKCDDAVYYQFTGNCASQIPLSVQQMQEIVKGAMSLAVGVGTFALGSAYGAGAHAAKQAVQTGTAMKAAGAAMVGSGLNSAAKGVNVSRSGTISAAAGLMGVQTPYLIISRPRQAIPENQSTYTGYPSFITEDLGELNGYTEVQMIHLHEMSCTEDEFNEIDELLAAGVIF